MQYKVYLAGLDKDDKYCKELVVEDSCINLISSAVTICKDISDLEVTIEICLPEITPQDSFYTTKMLSEMAKGIDRKIKAKGLHNPLAVHTTH